MAGPSLHPQIAPDRAGNPCNLVSGRGGFGHARDPGRKWTRIAPVRLRKSSSCDGHLMTTTDQRSSGRGREPHLTLATFRRGAEVPVAVFFGIDFFQESKSGTIRVGNAVGSLIKKPIRPHRSGWITSGSPPRIRSGWIPPYPSQGAARRHRRARGQRP